MYLESVCVWDRAHMRFTKCPKALFHQTEDCKFNGKPQCECVGNF